MIKAFKRMFSLQGCTSLRNESMKIHEAFANHVRALSILSAKFQPEKTPAFKIISSLDKDMMEKLN